MITKNMLGFTEIEMETENFAYLSGRYDPEMNHFFVAMCPLSELLGEEEAYYFDREAALEAAAFFNEIAKELERRGS